MTIVISIEFGGVTPNYRVQSSQATRTLDELCSDNVRGRTDTIPLLSTIF
jgi:hypothetical protein